MLDFLLHHVTVAAHQLDGVACHLDKLLAHEELGDRRMQACIARCAEGCRCPVDQPPRGLQSDLHVGNLVADCLVLADQLAELLSGARVPHRALEQALPGADRSEEHTSELQSLMRISYAVLCLKKIKQ